MRFLTKKYKWGRGLAAGQDGRHLVRLCRGRAILSGIIHPKRGGEGAGSWGFPPGALSALSGPGLIAAGARGAEERRVAWRRLVSARAGSLVRAGGVRAAVAPPD
ncbi:hypothetical protein NDU88_004062 [Pleurodeles waltl]|uniref:Uncharacterized protein n=1 Tax=Pleurodeles waltl TaxID=8319 RepID=A0AAV7SHQ2_PLEWA|nr:hypothetical protein NDU88_004062 [Pleurodeles waltl]